MSNMSQSEKDEIDFKLGQCFKPTVPINREELFFGRQVQVTEVLDAINQQGQHVILYGERGVGKTSLANMIFFRAQASVGYLLTPHVNCTSSFDYSGIWKAVVSDIAYRARTKNMELPRSVKRIINDFENQVRVDFTPDLARRMITDLWNAQIHIVVIIDEFDTVRDNQARLVMAETVKDLSDRNSPGTIVLIGVADDVESLITEHQSIERCIRQVRMPRMSKGEIEDIVTNSLDEVKMEIVKDALREISRIAIGLPHYAHLLGLHSGRKAIQEGSRIILQSHVTAAMRTAVSMAQVTIQNSYNKATISSKKNALYKQVLLACALAETDSFGYFSPSDVRTPLERVLKRRYGVEAFARHLHAFSEVEKGPVLRKAELTNRPRFRFENPLMQPFVLMKGLDEGIIKDDDLWAMRNNGDENLMF
jgi:Cdc6-like AAA superfamily ATPase